FGQHRSGSGGGVNENSDAAIRDIAKWSIQHRHRRFTEGYSFDVASDSDDFKGFVAVVIAKAPADRVFARPKRFRHCLADHCNPGGVFTGVVLGKIPSAQNGNAHGFEVTRGDSADVRDFAITLRILVAALGHNRPPFTTETERDELTEIGAADLRMA